MSKSPDLRGNVVIPAQAGIQSSPGKDPAKSLDASLRWHDRGGILSCLFLVVIYSAAWMIQSNLFLNWDVGHLLHASELLFAGGTYRHDFFIPNPPLILYLYWPPLLAQHHLGLNIILAFRLYIFGLVTLALALSYPLIQSYFQTKKWTRIFFFIVVATLLLLPLYDFGQRDYLLLVFTLPYLILMAGRLEGRFYKPTLTLLIGSFAFLGFGIKPQFCLIFLLLEAYYAFCLRSLKAWQRPEVYALSAWLLVYAFSSFVLYPDYFFIVIPFVLRNYYGAIGSDHHALFFNNTAIFCYLSLFFYLCTYKKDTYRHLNRVLVIALIGFLYSYFTQQTTFYYHLIPGLSIALILLSFGFAEFLAKPKPSKEDYWRIGIPAFCLAWFLIYYVRSTWIMFFFAPEFSFACLALGFAGLFYIVQQKKSLKTVFWQLVVVTVLTGLVYKLAHVTPGFTEHQSALTLGTMIILFTVLSAKQNRELPARCFLALLMLSLFSYPLFFTYCVYWRSVDYKQRVLTPLQSFMAEQGPNRSIYAFSIGTNISSPLAFYSGAKLAQRIDCFWPIIYTLKLTRQPDESLHAQNLTPQQAADDNFFINLIADDLYQQKPDLVFVDRKTRYIELGQHFDYVVYLSRNQKFRHEWQHYHFVKELSDGPFFRVGIYERKGA